MSQPSGGKFTVGTTVYYLDVDRLSRLRPLGLDRRQAAAAERRPSRAMTPGPASPGWCTSTIS
jgi:hypothetical protein